MSEFTLDPRLGADTIAIGDAGLSRILLMNDARFLWLILVPRRNNLVEIVDLNLEERAALMEEIAGVSTVLARRPAVDKINVGALGNVVRQLHVHIVARAIGDAAWPQPVWGSGARQPYALEAANAILRDMRRDLVQILNDAPRLA